MKRTKLTTVLSAAAVIVTVGAGTAVANGQTLTLTYGTAGFGGAGTPPVAVPPSQQHTGAVVPVWGSGPGASRILGTNDHTDLFRTLGG